MDFDDFWKDWPDKRNKESARKAFAKLKPDDQQKATERVRTWCSDWRKENPQASHIHASTYLNQKRFLDTEEIQHAKQVDEAAIRDLHASWIREGKRFLCAGLSALRARELIAKGYVSQDECERAGVL